MSNTKSVLGGGNYRELEESECSERVEATGPGRLEKRHQSTNNCLSPYIVWTKRKRQRNLIKLVIEVGGEGGGDNFT